jgi:hypothetical protein
MAPGPKGIEQKIQKMVNAWESELRRKRNPPPTTTS